MSADCHHLRTSIWSMYDHMIMYFYSFNIYIAITKYLTYNKLTFTYYAKVRLPLPLPLHVILYFLYFFFKAELFARTWCTRTQGHVEKHIQLLLLNKVIVIKNCTAFTFHYICISIQIKWLINSCSETEGILLKKYVCRLCLHCVCRLPRMPVAFHPYSLSNIDLFLH